jgi:sigma-B regulation protein RsbU (phosphoserine phosphatase)
MSVERSLQLYKGLVEISSLLVAITSFDELLSEILEVARRVMDAEASSLFITDEEGNLVLTLARSNGDEKPQRPMVNVPRGHGIAGWSLQNRKSVLVEDAYSDPRFYREADKQTGFTTRSILCAPLYRGTTEIGVLEVLNPRSKHSFDHLELEAFEAFANLAATAIDKVRAIERQREQDRVQRELALAHDIQAGFLPQSLPVRNGLVFAAHYRPARNIGGDFYDVIELGPDELYLVIGDVSGKGIPAALLMAQAISLLRLILQPGISPAAALSRWNSLLCGQTIQGMFVTAAIGRLTPSTRQFDIATAGHCLPVLVRDGDVQEIHLHGSPPLGILPEAVPEIHSISLLPNDWFLLYTDGLTESMNRHGELLDSKRAFEPLKRPFTSASEIIFALIKREEEHRRKAEPYDDLTLLLFGFR